MSDFTDSAESKQINQQEHNTDAAAKRIIIRAQDPATGNWVNIAATDNGDGTFSLKTSGASGAAAFSDSSGTDKKGLVDDDRHIQTDIVGELPTGTKTIGNVGKKLGATSTRTSVAASITVVTLKAANTDRIKLVIFNDSVADLYVAEGSAATTTNFTYKLLGGEAVIIDDYSGIVTGIWSAATGNARITETT